MKKTYDNDVIVSNRLNDFCKNYTGHNYWIEDVENDSLPKRLDWIWYRIVESDYVNWKLFFNYANPTVNVYSS